MKSHVGIYDTHEKALDAIEQLNEMNFSMENISLISKADIIDDHIQVKTFKDIEITPMLVCLGTGTFFGLLSGIGLIKIPGITLLSDSGALIGALLGFDIGLIHDGPEDTRTGVSKGGTVVAPIEEIDGEYYVRCF